MSRPYYDGGQLLGSWFSLSTMGSGDQTQVLPLRQHTKPLSTSFEIRSVCAVQANLKPMILLPLCLTLLYFIFESGYAVLATLKPLDSV